MTESDRIIEKPPSSIDDFNEKDFEAILEVFRTLLEWSKDLEKDKD